MGVKPTSALSESRVLPADWQTITLGSQATFKTGPFGSSLHRSDYVDDGVPVINPMHIVDGQLRPTSSMTVTEQAARRLSEFRMPTGTLVIGRRGEMGRCAYVPEHAQGWLCGTGSMIVRPGPSLDPRYLQRVLSSRSVIAQIENASVGSTMINLNQKTLGDLPIPLPSKVEQGAIAEALSDADARIESLEQLLVKKRQVKQGAMQALLTGKKRLPGFGGEWATETVESLERRKLLRMTRGKVISKTDIARCPGDYPIYSSSVTGDGTFGRYGDFMFDEELITWSIDGGGHFFYRPRHRFSVTNVCGVMRVDHQSLCCPFIAAQLQLLHSRLKFDYLVKAHPSVIRKAYRLSLPTPLEQAAIARVLGDMDAAISALARKIDKARQLKQGLMQELLTGRIRLG